MNPKETVLAQLSHKETTLIPYTLSYEEDVGKTLDEYYGSGDWRKKIVNHIEEVSLFDSEQRRPVGENRARDIYGSEWRLDLRPSHLEKPALKEASLKGYDFPTIAQFLDEEKRKQALKFCSEFQDRFLVASFGFGLFERTWTMRGFEGCLMDCICAPDFYEELLDRIFCLQMDFVEESLKLPVDGIKFSDDWGDQRGVILGPERWRRFLKPRLAKLYECVHQAGKVVLSHCCGSIADIMPDIIEIGLDVLESVQPEAWGMNPYELKKKFGDKIVFWGGLGSQSMIPFGTPAEIKAEVENLCREMGRGGGYILAPAKPLQSGTPVENAAAIVEIFTSQNKIK